MTHFDHGRRGGVSARAWFAGQSFHHIPDPHQLGGAMIDDTPGRRGPHPAIAPPRLDAATRTLLEARGPLAIAVLALGEEIWAATFDAARTPPDAVPQAFATVEAALAELRRAWRQAPLVRP